MQEMQRIAVEKITSSAWKIDKTLKRERDVIFPQSISKNVLFMVALS